MRLLFFTSLKAAHSRKWLSSLAVDFDVHAVVFRASKEEQMPGVTIHELLPKPTQKETIEDDKTTGDGRNVESGALETLKIGLRYGQKFAAVIDKLRPDIVHAHQSVPFGWYAARAHHLSLSKPPLIISTWGTDVCQYPDSSFLFRLINKKTLKQADRITATGKYLQKATRRWTNKSIDIVDFGVKTGLFSPGPRVMHDETKPFGIAKSLRKVRGRDIYGLETAIRALALAVNQDKHMRLEIAGDGPELSRLKGLAKKLGVSDQVIFLGKLNQQAISRAMRNWQALLLPSQQESFGVAALEAQASGIPILASRIGGIPEVTSPDTTRFVEPMNPQALATAMLKLASDPNFISSAYKHGPQFVADNYEWKSSVSKMEKIYNSL